MISFRNIRIIYRIWQSNFINVRTILQLVLLIEAQKNLQKFHQDEDHTEHVERTVCQVRILKTDTFPYKLERSGSRHDK